MFCSNCGKEMSENDKFCAQCGTYNEKYQAPVTAEAPKAPVEEDSLTAEVTASEVAASETVATATATEATAAEKAEPEVLYNYGQPAGEAEPAVAAPEEPKQAEVPAVFGILALIFSMVDSPVGLVFSIIGMCLYKDKTSTNWKRAKAGLIISIVLMAVMVLAVVAMVIFSVVAELKGWVTPMSNPYAFFEYMDYFYSY